LADIRLVAVLLDRHAALSSRIWRRRIASVAGGAASHAALALQQSPPMAALLVLPEQRLFTSGGLSEALSIKLEDPLPLDRHEPPPPSARFFVKKDHPPQFIDKKDHM
jgi:hypothetical protein